MQELALAIDIGGTKMAVGLVTRGGDLIDRDQVGVGTHVDAEAHMSALASMVSGQLSRASTHHGGRVTVVGVGSAGPIDRDVESVSPLNIPAWRGFPLRERLVDLTQLPVFGDLDAKALALAEGWRGAAQGCDDFIAMVVSTGVGGGIVLEGRLLDGSSGNAGHIGHVNVVPGGRRCVCGARGCLEAEASGPAIAAITGRPASEASHETMQRTGRLVGLAVASVCNLLDLGRAVVGGSVALGFGSAFFRAAQETLDEQAVLSFSRGARIVPARLGDSGPLVGAGAVGWRGLGRTDQPPKAR